MSLSIGRVPEQVTIAYRIRRLPSPWREGVPLRRSHQPACEGSLRSSVFSVLLIPSFAASREDSSPCSLCQSKDETQRSQSVSVCSVLVLLKAQRTRRSWFLVAASGPRWRELFPRVGFIVTNLETDSRAVVRFYNKRGTDGAVDRGGEAGGEDDSGARQDRPVLGPVEAQSTESPIGPCNKSRAGVHLP